MDINLTKLTQDGKCLILAYDHGLEHGPTDFTDENADPSYILDIAKKGGYTGVLFQKGIAQKYWDGGIPLVVKLNGKTNLIEGDPISPQLCTVQEAIDLGAAAVAYTIYVGSIHEHEIFEEFELIQAQAHRKGLPVIAFMYPRGAAIKDDSSRETLAYAARIGLELGADILKMKYNGKPDDLRWMVEQAGKARIVIAGGSKGNEKTFLTEAKVAMDNGALGLAVGRNVWQHRDPLKITAALKRVVFDNATVEEALKALK